MKLETLNEYVTLVKHLSFTSAARELYVSQPSLSNHISALERELGCLLIDRNANTLTLTPAGSEFLNYAQQILKLQEEALMRCRVLAKASPPVRIQAMPTESQIYQALKRIEEPSFVFVDVNLETTLFKAIEKGWVDAGMCSDYTAQEGLREQAEGLGIDFIHLGSNKLAFSVMRAHPLAAHEELTRADLKGQVAVINSGAHFDGWRRIVTYLLGDEVELDFRMNPVRSTRDLALIDLGDMIHICSYDATVEHFAHRSDMVVFDRIDGEELACPEGLAYRASCPQAAALAAALQEALSTPGNNHR